MTDKNYAELKVENQIILLPIKKSTIGMNVIDITKLYTESNYCTYDPGFISTASCKSSITYIDDNQGILMHRRYDIRDLATSCSFLDVCYLLLNGSLPTQKQNENFAKEVSDHTILTEQLCNLLITSI
ncbi:citrate/2-methylcitrate synthase [Orientia tsutsugamushi]|uniref:Citrate synthase n=1 Tax=Orientia tsutsugamushi TaxID=784 RepID=A0A2U3R6N8_ORITS|nr:citrate/2-methylcitrate synthase [Orientia tsutsugamushi]KJV76778.1 citrate synthase family protein [Orientia tsutsugamushi str. UT76]KJV93193.1 citrate synthase family protein [Orientia tsutsugamushi str. UT76]QES95651.1 hypothetical protein F0363_00855 [Orientia tsutsugamushi]SPR08894.1 citrate synthase [Orientia tsutsugamushi]